MTLSHRIWPSVAVFVALLLLAATVSAQRSDVFNATGATTNLTPSYDSRGGTVLLLGIRRRIDFVSFGGTAA